MAESEPRIEVVEAVTADPQELSAFLDEAFGPRKSRFLIEHGNWWHRGSGGRFVATYDGVIAGYRGMIPALCLVAGRETPAIWAVDLYVSPRFRGRGLQRLLDRKVLEGSQLRMSFPNKTAAQIYSRQGYGLRDDLRLLIQLQAGRAEVVAELVADELPRCLVVACGVERARLHQRDALLVVHQM